MKLIQGLLPIVLKRQFHLTMHEAHYPEVNIAYHIVSVRENKVEAQGTTELMA